MRNRAGRWTASRSKNARNVGLARALSKLGYCSRLEASELIRAGAWSLNGRLRRDPETPVHLGKDRIEIDGVTREEPENLSCAEQASRRGNNRVGRKKVAKRFTPTFPRNCSGLRPWAAWTWPAKDYCYSAMIPNGPRGFCAETHLDKTYHVQIGVVADEKLLADFGERRAFR